MDVSDETAHTGAMLALIPSAEDATRLAVDGGEPASELHVTLAYLGKAADLDAATRQNLIAATTSAVQGMPVVEGNAFGLASFGQGGDEPCNVLNVGGDMLDAAHHFLTEFVPFSAPDQHAPWAAHLTLEYTADLGRLAGYVDRLGSIRFDRVRLALGGDVIDIPLLPDDGVVEDDGYASWLAGQGLTEADTHPGDDGQQLRRYWLGKGLDKWATSGHPWTALYRHLRKYIKNIDKLKRTTSAWYRDHFGHMPNHLRPVTESARLVEAADNHPDSCEGAGLATVCHCGCNGTRHGEHRARTRLGKVNADRVDRSGGDVKLAAMTDDELAAQFARYSRDADWDKFAAIDAEMGRREDDTKFLDKAGHDDHWDTAGEPTEQDRQVDALLARGYDFADAYAEVFGGDAGQFRSQQRSSAVDRKAGESLDQAVRRGYDQQVFEQWMSAEADTRGNLLSKEGKTAGIDPVELFSGPAARARKYASEDLLRWWADNGRTTFTEYRAQVLGREADRKAAELTKVGGNGKDFI